MSLAGFGDARPAECIPAEQGIATMDGHEVPTRETPSQRSVSDSFRIAFHIAVMIAAVPAVVQPDSMCIAGAASPPSAEQQHGEFPSVSVKVGLESREFRLVVPETVKLSRPVPLVVAFHGILIDSKDRMPQYSKLNDTAAKYKFLLAYPEAIGKSWGIAPEKVKNDLQFFDALLEKVRSGYKVDAKRIYVLGMSNGGYFAHLIGKERATTVAAVASHSGTLGLQTLAGIRAQRKFPVLIIHGDEDRIFPVATARENRDKYRREGHEVQYVELKGVGHRWGTQAGINETIWKFFEKHPLD